MIAFLLGVQSNFNKNLDINQESQRVDKEEKLKVLVTHTEGSYLMEINSVPQPFDVAGSYPYVLWVNGERFTIPMEQLETIVTQIGKENIPLIDRNDIHKGWLRSFFATDLVNFSEPNTISKQ